VTTSAAAVRERRRSTRIPTLTPATLGPSTVHVFDVSLDGVGFRSGTPFPPASTHPIVIGTGPMYLEGTVRISSLRPRPDGTYDIGATFI
jgi:hypothetical protein